MVSSSRLELTPTTGKSRADWRALGENGNEYVAERITKIHRACEIISDGSCNKVYIRKEDGGPCPDPSDRPASNGKHFTIGFHVAEIGD